MVETPGQIKKRVTEWVEVTNTITKLELELIALQQREKELRNEILHEITAGANFLTIREKEVLVGVQAGKQNKEIAADLHLAVRTVKFHVSAILRKMKKQSRHDL